MRTYRTGRYDMHPSLGITPKRWLRTSTPIAWRFPLIYRIARVLHLDDDETFADAVISALIDYISEGRGEAAAVLAAIGSLYSGYLRSWSLRNSDVRAVADEYFLSRLVDGRDFLDAIEYLKLVDGAELFIELRSKLISAIAGYFFG
jgi:hypothetical protein